jgi:hypothetical protein
MHHDAFASAEGELICSMSLSSGKRESDATASHQEPYSIY